MTMQWIQRHSAWLEAGLLGILALGLRVWGIGFDLPMLYHRDEAKYVTIPLQILKTGDYNPHFFNYPSLFFYLLAVVYGLYFLALASRGRVGSLDGLVLPEQVMANVVGRATMPSQFLIGRGLVAITGTATVLLTYWLGRRIFGRRSGLIAAALLAVSPIHVRNSHFIAPDVPMALLTLASFALSYRVSRSGRRADYVLAGLLAGLAMATKYNAYPILVPLVVAHLHSQPRERWLGANLALAGATCALGFLAASPFSFLDLPAFLNGIAFEVRHYAMVGDPGIEGQNAWLWYAGFLLRQEGLAPLLAAIQGLRALWHRHHGALLVLSFPLTYLVLVSFYTVKNDRTLLTVLPFLALLAGRLAADASTWSTQQLASRGVRVGSELLVALVAVALCVSPAWQAVQIDRRLVQEDVRTQITHWMFENLPSGSRVAGEYYSPLLDDNALEFVWLDRAIDVPLGWYQANVEYVVLVENRYGGFYLDPARYRVEVAAYEKLRTQFSLVASFAGGALGNPCQAFLYRVQA